jgi:uncharacterized protein
MTAPGGVVQRAAFVRGAAGSRFQLISEPAHAQPLGSVIAVHAFAEEMNKSRRMCARMARALAGAGWRVVQTDLFGCGDSDGDFADASWAAWQADIDAELARCDDNAPVWLWGLRAGALLACAAAARRPDARLLLWQPVASGAQHLQQFLRLHAGARIVGSAKSASEVSPAQRLRAGIAVEVGGYDLSPALAAGMEQASLDLPESFVGRVVWLEVSGEEAPQLSPAATRTIERLQARQIRVDAEAVRGPAFWQTQEIEECEPLLARSLDAVTRLNASPTDAPRVSAHSA